MLLTKPQMTLPTVASALFLALLPVATSRAEAPMGDEKKIKVLMSVFADDATDKNGKMSLSGTFDTLVAKSVPVEIAACTYCLRMQFLSTAYGDHKVRIEIANPDGKPVLVPKLERPFRITPTQPASTFITKNLLFNLKGITLGQFGIYKASIFIDDVLVSDQRLLLKSEEP